MNSVGQFKIYKVKKMFYNAGHLLCAFNSLLSIERISKGSESQKIKHTANFGLDENAPILDHRNSILVHLSPLADLRAACSTGFGELGKAKKKECLGSDKIDKFPKIIKAGLFKTQSAPLRKEVLADAAAIVIR